LFKRVNSANRKLISARFKVFLATVIDDNNADIPFKSKRIRKAPTTRSHDFLW
jgi:hypothetical protein